jgi:hypothetical protein
VRTLAVHYSGKGQRVRWHDGMVFIISHLAFSAIKRMLGWKVGLPSGQ